jgi:glyoxylase-like metal-dependent hydrolase (beta-lactamase superfamily II)
MTYTYDEQAGNVYLIDTNMFGFDRFQSCYLVKGEEIALIDTGVPTSIDWVRDALKKHGAPIGDIAHIFVTHGEHPDHSGNVGAFVRENTEAKVYIHPIGLEYLTRPEIEAAKRKAILPPEMAARFGDMVPVPEGRIRLLKDGDRIDLGGGQTLRVVFTPGHQPSGLVIYDEKNQGLFINDLIGLYLADADFSMILTPKRSEVEKYMESLNRVKALPLKTLFMGHFGISNKPGEVIERALGLMKGLMAIGAACMDEGRPEEIAPKLRTLMAPELEKIRKARGDDLYLYLRDELVVSCSEAFSSYYQSLS